MFDGGTDVDPAIPVSRPHPSSFRWRRCFKSPDQAFLGLREPLPPRLDRHPPSAARTGDGTTGLLIRPAAVESPNRAVGRERTVSLRHRSDSQIGHHANHQPCEPPCKKKVFLQVSGRLSRPRRGLNGWSSTPTHLVTTHLWCYGTCRAGLLAENLPCRRTEPVAPGPCMDRNTLDPRGRDNVSAVGGRRRRDACEPVRPPLIALTAASLARRRRVSLFHPRGAEPITHPLSLASCLAVIRY